MTRILIATTAAAASLAAGAATADVVGESHSYTVGETEFEGYVARNTNLDQTKGTVLIVHDWDGLTDYERRRAEMLAALGYTAFAIDVYGADVDPQGREDYQRLSGELYQDRETFRERLLGSVDEVANIEGASEAKVIMGYCFGGAAVLEAARAGAPVQGFVSFHGGLGVPEGQDYADAPAPIRMFHGSADPVSDMATFASEIQAMTEAEVDVDADVYGGALHSFTVFGSDDYDLDADQRSWTGLQEFLEENLDQAGS